MLRLPRSGNPHRLTVSNAQMATERNGLRQHVWAWAVRGDQVHRARMPQRQKEWPARYNPAAGLVRGAAHQGQRSQNWQSGGHPTLTLSHIIS